MYHVELKSPFRYPSHHSNVTMTASDFSNQYANVETKSRSSCRFRLRQDWRMDEDRIIELATMRTKVIHRNRTKQLETTKTAKSVCDRQHLRPSLMLHPQSIKRLIWDFCFILFVVYDLIYLPLQAFKIQPSDFSQSMQVLCSLFWTLDMVITCFTGTYMQDDLVMDQRIIVGRYLKTWFFCDLVLVLPQWVILCLSIDEQADLGSKESGFQVFRTVRAMRFLRLVRVWKFKHVMLELQYLINSTSVLLLISLVRQMVSIIFLNHWIACLWFGISSGEADGWVQRFFENDATVEDQYLTSFQWSVSQLQGSTDIYPVNTKEYIVSIIVLLCTLLIFSSFLSSITNTMQQLHTLSAEAHREQFEVRKFLRDHQISMKLAVRVKKFVDWRTSAKLTPENDVAMIKVLPMQMLVDIHQEIRAPVITQHFFFSTLQTVFPRVLRQLCHEAVDQVIFSISESIFFAGDACNHMYFAAKGHLRYHLGIVYDAEATHAFSPQRSPRKSSTSTCPSIRTSGNSLAGGTTRLSGRSASGKSVAGRVRCTSEDEDGRVHTSAEQGEFIVQENEWLSEPVLWTYWEHHGDLRAVSNVVVFRLSACSFAETLLVHPSANVQAVIYARGLIEDLNNCGVVSDIFGHRVKPHNPQHDERASFASTFAKLYC